MQIKDSDLVLGIRANDPACLKLLVDKYSNKLLSLAIAQGLSRQDGLEAVNDSIYKIVKNISRFDLNRGSSFTAWVMRIAINTAKDKIKKIKNYSISQSLDEQTAKGIQDSETLWQEPTCSEHKIPETILCQALECLSESDQEIIRCCACDIPQKEIAKSLNKTVGAVKVAHHRAKEKLRDKFIIILDSYEDQRASMEIKKRFGIEASNEKSSN